MGVIRVKIPGDEIVNVKIEGEAPTELEQQAIFNTFFNRPSVRKDKELDFAKASREEIREFVQKKRELGIEPGTNRPLEDEDALKDKDVDYTSGLQIFSIRAGLGQRENDEERALYLTDKVGADGFRQDRGGRFILTKAGRKKLGLADGPELAIDEEGFNFKGDLADFIGEAGTPLAVGVGASIAFGGLGALTALPLVGVSMGAAKLFDEAIETAQGYQTQSKEEQLKDAAFEGVFGTLGEGFGRVVSRLLGGLVKGSASTEAEQAKTLGREMLKKGFRPTVEGGAPGAFGILGRLQAVYEGVIPNKRAATENVKAIMREMKRLGTADDTAIDRLGQTVIKDLDEIYETSEETFQIAQKVMSKEIETEIARIMEPLKRGEELGTDAALGLQAARTVFNKQVDKLYKTVEDKMGRNNEIVPIGDLELELNALKESGSDLGALINRKFKRILDRSRSRAEAKVNRIVGDGFDGVDIDPNYIAKHMFVTPQKAQLMRKILADLEGSPIFQQNYATGNQLRELMDVAFQRTEDNLNLAKTRIESGFDGVAGVGIDQILDEANVGAVALENLKDGFTLLRRTNRFYARGNQRFSDPVVANLYRLTRSGKLQTDPTAILDLVIKSNQPKLLERLLQSRRGIFAALPDPDAPTVRFGDAEYSIEEAKRLLDTPIQDKSRLRDAIRIAEEEVETIAKETRKLDETLVGGMQGEELRQQLARAWFTRLMSNKAKTTTIKDGVEVYDGAKIAGEIKRLGTTRDVLFRDSTIVDQLGNKQVFNTKQEIDDLVSLLSGTGATFDREVFRRLANNPLAQAAKGLREEVAKNRAINSQGYIRSLRQGDPAKIVDTIFQKQNPERVRQFMNNNVKVGAESVKFAPETHRVLKQEFQDAAMARILRSLGDTNSPLFKDDFLSGRLGSKFQTTLNGYGRETLSAAFGKETSNDLFNLAEVMVRASDQPLAGKGGLAAPNIALGLSLFGIIANPLATLPTLLFFTGMSKALRRPEVLKVLLASRRPGEDAIGRAVQTMQTIASQIQFQALESREGPLSPSPEVQQEVQQQLSGIRSAIPNVAPAFGGTPAANVDPTNPIVNPDPATQALAQALSQRPPS